MRNIFVVILLFLGLKLAAQAQLQNLPVPALKHLAHNAADSVAVNCVLLSSANQPNGFAQLDGVGMLDPLLFYQLQGDVVSDYTNNNVNKIQGIRVPTTSPTDGQIWSYELSTNSYRFINPPSGSNSWNLSGNAGTTSSTNFIGTTDNQDVVFKLNNAETARFNGNYASGAPTFQMDNRAGPYIRMKDISATNNVPLTVEGGNASGGTNLYGSPLILRSGAGTGNANSSITFNTGTPVGSGSTVQSVTEKMRIDGNGNVGIGTTSPTAKLDINGGTIKIVDGNQGSGKVLTSDANGLASWQTLSGGGGSGTPTEVYVWSTPTTTNFVVPINAKSLDLFVMGAGGGGGSGRTGAAASARPGGGGGASGNISTLSIPVSALSTLTLTVTCGTGGTGAGARTSTNSNGGNGATGQSSSITNGSNTIILASGGGGGVGATATTGVAGAVTLIGQFSGLAGAAAGASGAAGSGSATSNSIVSTGGGGGGGVTAADVANPGGGAGAAYFATITATNAEANGTNNFLNTCGTGGGGGGGSITANAANGGNGGIGAGGGGGGGALNGFSSGAGGNGGSGYVRIVVHY